MVALRVTVQTATPLEVEAFAALSAREFGEDASVADRIHVRWKHVDGPAGPSTAVDLREGERAVGRLWVQPRPWTVAGQERVAANPIDLLIDADHRDLMAFLRLWRKAAAESATRDFWYHTSNPVSDELYSRMLHYSPQLELDGHVAPLRVGPLAALAGIPLPGPVVRLADTLLIVLRAMGAGVAVLVTGVRASDQQATEDELRALFAEHHRREPTSGARSPQDHAWRWAAESAVAYRRLPVRGRTGRLLGLVVLREQETDGVRGAFVVDVVAGSGMLRHRTAAWLSVARTVGLSGADALFLFCNRGNPALRRLSGLPWVLVPRARLPQRVPVFVHGDAALRDAMPSAYMTLADFDLF